MLDTGKLAEHLIGSGLVRAEQFEEAKRCVSTGKLSLDKALVALKLVDFVQLGKAYSDICKLPYMPIVGTRPADEVRSLLSAECAAAWKVFPWAYDPYENLLTVAVHEPEQVAVMERVTRFFMQPYTIVFTVASLAEIEEALSTHYGIGAGGALDSDVLPAARPEHQSGVRPRQGVGQEGKKVQLVDRSRPAQAEPAPAGPEAAPADIEPAAAGARQPVAPSQPVAAQAGRKASPEHGAPRVHGLRQKKTSEQPDEKPAAHGQEFSYNEMRRVLKTAAALVVKASLEKNEERLNEVASMVRYCELLSSRLAIPPTESDAAVLAAWLSGLEGRRDMLSQLVTPYKLEEIVACGTRSEGNDRIAARILSLVKCYQGLSRSDPESARDVALMRRLLRREWSSSPVRQDMLETFLQVLMDEQFMNKLDRAAGKILIVDPAEEEASVLGAPLAKHGYEVRTAATAEGAESILSEFAPDLVICEMDLPKRSGMDFCGRLKDNPSTAGIRLFMMSGRSGKEAAASCLRAGAEDFFPKPVDLEVLFLRTRQMMAAQGTEGAKEGVTGQLSEMNFTDMVQVLTTGGKSKELVLTRDGVEGRVFVNNGEVIHAETGGLKGETAFYELMTWEHGQFTMKQCSQLPGRTIEAPVMSLLMEGAKLIDEARGGVQPEAPGRA